MTRKINNLLLYLLLLTTSCVTVPAHAKKTSYKMYIPVNYPAVAETVYKETLKYFPEVPLLALIPAQIEQENCITKKSKRCWNHRTRLKTSREEGIGFSMTTRAYGYKNGKRYVRMDALAGMKRKYPKLLKELNWGNIRERPDLQIRIMLLHMKTNWNQFPNAKIPMQRWHFAATSYNGGSRDVKREIQACAIKKGCDPQYWEGNVQKIKGIKSNRVIYGRTIWTINHTYTKTIIEHRLPMYKLYYKNNKWTKPTSKKSELIWYR